MTNNFIWCTLRVHQINNKFCLMVTKLIGVKEFRQNMAKYMASGRRHGWRYVVLSRNEPIGEVRPFSKKEATLEKLAAEIAEARQQARDGRGIPLEEALRSLGL